MTLTTVFHHVRIFDGALVLPADTVVVQENTIMAVGSDLALPTSTIVIDGTGQTLLPGLIDAHTLMAEVSATQAPLSGPVPLARLNRQCSQQS